MNLDILPSLEVRWFFNDDAKPLLEWWPQALPKSEGEGQKEDIYFQYPGAEFVGVKLREYRAMPGASASLNLEFKLREQEYGTLKFNDRISGVVQRWRKWSAKVNQSANDYMAAASGENAGWIRVRKSRQLQKFGYLNHQLNAVPVSERPEEGCNVELSDVTPQLLGKNPSTTWKSLCFEAFSSKSNGDLTNLLWRTANHVFSITAAPALTVEHSYGYPEWLVGLRGDGKRAQ